VKAEKLKSSKFIKQKHEEKKSFFPEEFNVGATADLIAVRARAPVCNEVLMEKSN
jgi:hypothetical protein